ncbi:hypothetical protein Syun_029471 [Stephania yunnanensis]|uniref:Uncharacterized protein n=1 Tax=Stephania yunnanensis TaxID=152371 RepID=A0AAP0EA19_9MAGN
MPQVFFSSLASLGFCCGDLREESPSLVTAEEHMADLFWSTQQQCNFIPISFCLVCGELFILRIGRLTRSALTLQDWLRGPRGLKPGGAQFVGN